MPDEPLSMKTRYEHFKRYYTSLEPVLAKPKNRIYTAIIFSFLAISLFGWYAIRPTIQTILLLRREIADKTIVNEQMEKKIADLIEAQAAYEAVQTDLPLVDEAIPTNPQAIDIASQLKNLVLISQATYTAIRVSEVPLASQEQTQDKQPKTIPSKDKGEFFVHMVIEGSFTQLEQFLNNLLSMRRVTTIDSVSILPSQEAVSTGSPSASLKSLKLTVQFKAYYK